MVPLEFTVPDSKVALIACVDGAANVIDTVVGECAPLNNHLCKHLIVERTPTRTCGYGVIFKAAVDYHCHRVVHEVPVVGYNSTVVPCVLGEHTVFNGELALVKYGSAIGVITPFSL